MAHDPDDVSRQSWPRSLDVPRVVGLAASALSLLFGVAALSSTYGGILVLLAVLGVLTVVWGPLVLGRMLAGEAAGASALARQDAEARAFLRRGLARGDRREGTWGRSSVWTRSSGSTSAPRRTPGRRPARLPWSRRGRSP